LNPDVDADVFGLTYLHPSLVIANVVLFVDRTNELSLEIQNVQTVPIRNPLLYVVASDAIGRMNCRKDEPENLTKRIMLKWTSTELNFS
jgi:hypothetical protein